MMKQSVEQTCRDKGTRMRDTGSDQQMGAPGQLPTGAGRGEQLPWGAPWRQDASALSRGLECST